MRKTEEMELMDWKDIEHGAESTIRQAKKDTEIAHILLKSAQQHIKALGGQTNEEIDNESKNKINPITR